VYFNQLHSISVTEHFSDSFSQLVSDTGGQMGLWMGLSMIGVLEVLKTIFEWFMERIGLKKGKTVNKIEAGE